VSWLEFQQIHIRHFTLYNFLSNDLGNNLWGQYFIEQKTSPTSSYSFFPLFCAMDNLEGKHKHEYSNDAYLSNFLWDSIAQTSQGKQRKHEIGYDWYDSYGKKPPRCEKNKLQTATLISLQFWGLLTCAQLHSDWSLHNKPVRMKQMPPLPPLKKRRKAKISDFALFRFSQPCLCSLQSHCGSFHYISVSFQLVPVHSGTTPVHSASFCLILVYSGSFRYNPFRSIPFLCLVTPELKCICYTYVIFPSWCLRGY